ncbi:hypothetical protein HOK51_07070 [Candidatus Woesearchaeota archaeon]|jgi:hypothetical protein|nr:hypothetical protein [Candidatus Woesearchaeota archaeon]MBT6519582.1 hypothetical protein [Candidatus Woesearchaeota archaeon]MBT7367673.1 hypothetical protein [Candidatus Woesearchaeota archaeon]
MQETDIKTLELAGLTHAQAVIYLTLLEIGQSKIGMMIEKTKLQSSVVHNNVNKLIELGLINFVLVGKIRHYQVADPDVFLNFLDDKKKEIDESKKEIQKILPKLKLIKESTKQKTNVEVFKGRRGFQSAYLEEYNRIKQGEETVFIGLPKEYQQDEEIHKIFNKLDLILREKKCSIRGLGHVSNKKIWDKFYSGSPTYSMKYLDEDFPWGVMIFGDGIILAMWGDEPILIKVKNKKFRDNALNYFESKWKEAKN